MQTIGTYDLKTHLSEVLTAVERGKTIVVTRHGRAIARISPDHATKYKETRRAIAAIARFRRTRLPKGVTIRSLIEDGRH